ncbi:uncharacterized protein BJ212DRAFT_1318098, partial [Suillus subaureus]
KSCPLRIAQLSAPFSICVRCSLISVSLLLLLQSYSTFFQCVSSGSELHMRSLISLIHNYIWSCSWQCDGRRDICFRGISRSVLTYVRMT